ncbi:MAG: hypothetical protein ABW321_07510 [Polyangiales bacterium]
MNCESRNPKVAGRGKVIPFPGLPRPELPPPLPLTPPQVNTQKPRRVAWSRWSLQLWLVAAWCVCADHLQHAIDRREVFGAIDGIAFLVAVVMPVFRLRAWLELFTRRARQH